MSEGAKCAPSNPLFCCMFGCARFDYKGMVYISPCMQNPAYNAYRSHDLYCAICMNECFVGVTFLSHCGHHFHRVCLEKCLRAGIRTCPICRSPDMEGVTCTPSLSEDVYHKLLGRRYLDWWNTIPSERIQ